MRSLGSLTVTMVVFMPTALLACSAMTLVMDGKVVVAGNNDAPYSLEMKLSVTPSRDGLFGRMCISMDTVPGWTPVAMKCMNDQGLVATHANVPRSQTPYDPDKPHFRHNFLEKIVSECASVKQAAAMVQAYTLPQEHGAHVHLMLADVSGDSAVVEWVDGEVKVLRRTGPTQFMTNSLLSKPGTAGGPNSRYARGSRMLAELEDASEASIVAVLKEISVRGRFRGEEVGTIDSTVWDVTGRKLHLFYKRDFDHVETLNLDEELGKGARTVELKTLFPNPVPFEPGWRDENGPVTPKPAK